MRTVSRLRLLFLLLRPGYPCPNGFCFAELSTLLLFAQSILCHPHLEELAFQAHQVEARANLDLILQESKIVPLLIKFLLLLLIQKINASGSKCFAWV